VAHDHLTDRGIQARRDLDVLTDVRNEFHSGTVVHDRRFGEPYKKKKENRREVCRVRQVGARLSW
jgi:hypothetical protein